MSTNKIFYLPLLSSRCLSLSLFDLPFFSFFYGRVIVRQNDRIIPIYSANRPTVGSVTTLNFVNLCASSPYCIRTTYCLEYYTLKRRRPRFQRIPIYTITRNNNLYLLFFPFFFYNFSTENFSRFYRVRFFFF